MTAPVQTPSASLSLVRPKVDPQPSSSAKKKEHFARRAFNYVWNLPWNIAHPGKAGGASALQGAKEEALKILADDGPQISRKLREILSNAIMKSCPAPLLVLRDLLAKSTFTWEEIEQMKKILSDLGQDGLLESLAMHLADSEGHPMELSDEARGLIPNLLKEVSSLKEPEQKSEGKRSSDPLPPVISEQAKALMKQAHSLVEILIKGNQGILNNGTDFIAAFLEKLLHDENSGLLKKLESNLTNEEKGLFQKVITWAKAKINEKGGIVEALNDSLNSQPHPLLKEAREVLKSLDSALKANESLENLSPKAAKALSLLEDLMKNKDKIFAKNPLEDDKEAEINFLLYLLGLVKSKEENPESLPFYLKNVLETFDEQFLAQEGLVARSARVFVQSIVTQIADTSKRALASLKPQKKEKKAEAKQPEAPEEASEEMPLKDYLSSAVTFLGKCLGEASEIVQKPAAKAFGSSLLWILRGVENRTKDNENYKETYQIVKKLIENIQKAMEKEDIHALVDAINASLKHSKYLQIYLNGVKVPKISLEKNQSSSITAFLSNIQKHEAAINQNPKKEVKNENYEKLIQEEREIFIKKTSCFGAMKLACYVAGVPAQEDFYSKVLQSPEDKLRENFFKGIEEMKIPFFKKVIVKFLYRIIHPLSMMIIKQIATRFIKEINQGIHKGFSGLEVSPFRRFSSYLSILGECYNRAANNPTGSLEESIVHELEDVKCNKGFTSKQLYQAVSKKFVNQFTPQIEWTISISNWFKNLRFPEDSKLKCLNALLNVIMPVVSFFMCAILYLPEKILNLLIPWILKKFVLRTSMLDDMLHYNMEALKNNNNYIYALNKVIYEQLETVWEILQNSVKEDGGLDIGAVDGAQSKNQREELTILVKHLMEVLAKSKYHTPEELRKAIKDKSIFKQAREMAEGVFINEAVDAATRLIGAVYKSLIPKNQLQKLFYNFLNMVNRSYSSGKPVTTDEYQALEKGIDSLSAKILTLAIQLSLERRFDFTLKDQKKEATKFVLDLQSETAKFAKAAKASVTKLQEEVADFALSPSQRKFPANLESVIAASIDFQRKRISPQFDVNSNPNFDIETKKNLDRISLDVATHFAAFGKSLDRIETLRQKIELREKNMQELKKIQDILEIIDNKMNLKIFSIADVRFCQPQIAQLSNVIDSLSQVDRLKGFTDQLKKLKNELAESIKELGLGIQLSDTLSSLAVKKGSLFYRFVLEKKRALSSTPNTLTALHKELISIAHSISDEEIRKKVMERIEAVMNAPNTERLQDQAEIFENETNELIAQTNQKIEKAKEQVKKTRLEILQLIEKSGETKPEKVRKKVDKIRTLLGQTKTQLKEIRSWTKKVEPIAFFNPPFMDMNWLIDMTKNLAYNQIEEVVQEFLKFAHKHYNFLGFIRHGILIPYATGAL